MRSRQIQAKFQQFLGRFGPDRKIRLEKEVQQWMTFRTHCIQRTIEHRARLVMYGWLKEQSRQRKMLITFQQFISKLKLIIRVCEEIYFTKMARPKILDHRLREFKSQKIVEA